MTWPGGCGRRLTTEFYARDTPLVARDLVGMALLRCLFGDDGSAQWCGGWIVETEAYLHDKDAASHSARGKTPSNASMFGRPGMLYVYPIHAKHCLNAVTDAQGRGCAVLIRAIEPIWGLETMQKNRSQQVLKRLTSGPAMLCQALAVDRKDDGKDLVEDDAVTIAKPTKKTLRNVVACPRIGISKAQELPLRFVDSESPFLSRKVGAK